MDHTKLVGYHYLERESSVVVITWNGKVRIWELVGSGKIRMVIGFNIIVWFGKEPLYEIGKWLKQYGWYYHRLCYLWMIGVNIMIWLVKLFLIKCIYIIRITIPIHYYLFVLFLLFSTPLHHHIFEPFSIKAVQVHFQFLHIFS